MPEDSVEADVSAASTTDSTGTDTGSTSPATADTSPSSAPPAGDSSATTGSAPATATDTQVADGDRSLTDGAETNPPQDPPDDGYKKRWEKGRDTWKQERARAEAYAKRVAELEAQTKRYEGIPLDEAVQHYQRHQGLKPWDEGHAENAKFTDLWNRTQWANEMARRAEDPALRKAILDQHFDSLTAADQALLQEHQAFVRAEQREQAMNPAAYYRKLVQRHAQPVVQQGFQSVAHQHHVVNQAQQAVQKWIDGNPEMATAENRRAIADLMQQHQIPFEQAVVQWELSYWKGKVSGVDAKAKSVEEKERLLQGKAAATVVKNPATKKAVSFSQYLKDQNISKSDSGQVADALLKLQAQGVNLID